MVDVIVSAPEITVLKVPTSVDVSVDFGATGQRGSQWFAGMGNPNDVVIGQTPILFDMYINVLPSDPNGEYLYIYQYQYVDGLNTWVSLAKAGEYSYAYNHSAAFTAGTASVSIPITSIVPSDVVSSLTESNFIVTLGPEQSTDVVVASVASKTISAGNLVLSIKAAKYDGTWASLAETIALGISIRVV